MASSKDDEVGQDPEMPVAESRSQSYAQTPSETPNASTASPSNHREVSTDVTTAPKTQSEDHNTKYLFQARNLLLRILENSCGILKAAIGIFEKHQAQHYRRYIWLREQFGRFLALWAELEIQANPTIESLQSFASRLLLEADIRRLSSPRNAASSCKGQMQTLRNRMSEAQEQTARLRDKFDEAVARLEECGGDLENTFADLPRVEEILLTTPDHFDIAQEFDSIMHPEQPLEEDDENNEENWIFGDCRDPDDLKAHGFQPVWTGLGGGLPWRNS